jgi:thiamine biosynthesis lipoprotein
MEPQGIFEYHNPARSGVRALPWSLLALILFTGCTTARHDSDLHLYEFKSAHMGTLFTIKLYATAESEAQVAAQAAFKRIAVLEDVMSDYQADSELMRLCDQPWGKPVRVSEDLFRVLQVSQEYAGKTHGAFDVTVGPYVRLWRFSRKRKTLPTAEELARAREAVGWQKLKLDSKRRAVTLSVPNMRLDLGGIGKGFAADEALKVLKHNGLTRALVAASGDIVVGDPPPGATGWSVAINIIDSRTNTLPRSLLLRNGAISTSGDSEQFVEIDGMRYSHIVDPWTGLGLTSRLQSTVVGPNATTTDALDTPLCVLGLRAGLSLIDSLPNTRAIIIRDREPPAASKWWRW